MTSVIGPPQIYVTLPMTNLPSFEMETSAIPFMEMVPETPASGREARDQISMGLNLPPFHPIPHQFKKAFGSGLFQFIQHLVGFRFKVLRILKKSVLVCRMLHYVLDDMTPTLHLKLDQFSVGQEIRVSVDSQNALEMYIDGQGLQNLTDYIFFESMDHSNFVGR